MSVARSKLAALALLACSGALLYWRVLGKLIHDWATDDNYSHGFLIVPLSLYFNGSGRAKVELALARGKKVHDKREVVKERDWKREQQRLLRRSA